jgi:D-3-phosphoglycerate dehydrogenase
VALEIAEQVAAYLVTGAIQNAVNVPSVSSEVAPKLEPYTDLAERLGRFLAQVEPMAARSIQVECHGEPGDLSVKAIASAAVAGYLQRYLDAPVNQVSAAHLAKDRGIDIREVRREAGFAKFSSLVALRVEAADGSVSTAWGTLGSNRSARLVRWGEFDIEAELGGNALVVTSLDRPGVIGFLGTALGAAGVNVAAVHLGKSKPGSAVSVWNLDQAIPTSALDAIRGSDAVSRALVVEV